MARRGDISGKKKTLASPDMRTAWRNRVVELRSCRPSDLVDHPKQWRVHGAAQRAAMQSILEAVGIAGAGLAYVSPSTGLLTSIDGHLRKSLVDAPFPTLILDLDDAEADVLLASFDPLSTMAEANRPMLAALLQDVQTENAGLQQMLEGLALSEGLAALVGTQLALPESAGSPEQEMIQTTPVPAPQSNVRMVQLFLTEESFPMFQAQVGRLASQYGTTTITDTVLECLSRAADPTDMAT